MKRAFLLLLVACSGAPRQESVTVVAPPQSQECPSGTVFNGVTCAELLSHAASIDAGAPVVTAILEDDDAPPTTNPFAPTGMGGPRRGPH